MWKKLRIAVLLFILATVALGAWRAKHAATDWKDTLHVALYPINADGSAGAAKTIAALDAESFSEIDDFFAEEAARYGLKTLRPVHVTVQPALTEAPPAPPSAPSMFGAIAWSLKLRWWAWRQPDARPIANVRLFVNYYDPEDGRVPNSHGLQEGLIGVVNVFATRDMRRANEVVIAHELLHTLGATDKYDFSTLEPRYPEGFAEPDKEPRYPQRLCELMAGRIPKENADPEQPRALDQCLIGEQTAREVGLRHP